MNKETIPKKYKIVGFCQIFNEIEKGNLQRFVKYIKPLVDDLVVYDDASTDGSYEYMLNHTEHVIRGVENDFTDELYHKKQLLKKALSLKPDFILSLDADEILTSNAKTELQKLCSYCIKEKIDGVFFKRLNLWRNQRWKRTDSLFNDGGDVKLWKVTSKMYFKTSKGLHKRNYPKSIHKIEHSNHIYMIHYGFADIINLAYKYWIYKKHGQCGYDMLDRLIYAKNLKMEKLPQEYFPKELRKDGEITKPITLDEALREIQNYKNMVFRPKFSIICLIYKNTDWLEFVYQQVLKYTNMKDKEFFFIANDATNEVKEYLKNSYIPYYTFQNTIKQQKEWYINNVYRAYNFGAMKAKGDFIIFINSDMAFSPDWFKNLWKNYNGKNCINARLVESGKLKSGLYGIGKNFGRKVKNYKEKRFNMYAKLISQRKVKDGGLYMPLLIRKDHFMNVGMYPEGNVLKGSDFSKPVIAKQGEPLIAGDAVFMNKLEAKGIKHCTSFDSIVYHFQCGEKDDKISNKKNDTRNIIAICNDSVKGNMGERVLWQYLCEELPNIIGVDNKILSSTSKNYIKKAKKYIKQYQPNIEIILQNATFMDIVDKKKFTMVYLQDNLRNMQKQGTISNQKEIDRQTKNLNLADLIVTNSIETSKSYEEYNMEIIPIGVDETLFKPLNQKIQLRKEFNFPAQEKIGIFVGALNEVKGWSKIKSIIKKNKDIFWIIVSKNANDEFISKNAQIFNRINHQLLVKLYNCADFFILGSQIETQCLAAIEAALCNIPIIMHNTGIFADFNMDEKEKLGIFNEDLNKSLKILLEKNKLENFDPRKVILKKELTINHAINKWHDLFGRARQLSISNSKI